MKRRRFLLVLLGIMAAPLARFKPMTKHNRHVPGPEAEITTVGALLHQPELLPDVEKILTGSMFRHEQPRRMYEWMIDRRRQGLPHGIDSAAALQAHRVPVGPQTLRSWVEDVPNFESACEYARVVRDRRPGLGGMIERWRNGSSYLA